MGRAYKLFSNATATTAAAASLRVTKKTRIRCILFTCAATAGAAVDGRGVVELSKQNASSVTINDTPETVLASCFWHFPISAGAGSVNSSVVCDIPCDQGDTLYLNWTSNGTAAASISNNVYLFTSD